MDRFSPLAPARVRALLLPVGKVERNSFNLIVDELTRHASILPLKDLPVDANNDFTLSPLRSAQASVLINYTTSETTEQLRQLSPFEIWRETLLVIGVAANLSTDVKRRTEELKQAATELHERHNRVVHRHLLVLDDGELLPTTADVTSVKLGESPDVLPAARHIIVRFLQELTTYLAAMQASPSIQTPGQTSQGLLRAMLQREDDGRPASRQSTPIEPRSPSEEESGSRPASQDVMPPPTTFDQIPAANTLGRSDSNASGRSKSHTRNISFERVPVQNLSKDKLRDRGKARVGIVAGSIFLMAGHWPEALKLLVESTTRLRSLHDHIWNGKGLELIVVCLMLHLWSGMDVQVPAICFQLSPKVRDRLSKSFAAELAQKLTSPQTPIEKLSSSLHDLTKHVLVLYHSIEDNIELPYVVVAEATVRFCKILACTQSINGLLTERSIAWLVEHRGPFTTNLKWSASTFQPTKPLTKSGISDMLSNALPLSDESISIAEHINILTGIASVYAILNMDRKKAITLKALVARLTTALNQARKLGAAEMGIHPAATLSAENGSEALLSTAQGSVGFAHLAQSLASVYGVDMDSCSSQQTFGSRTLQTDILRDLLKLCEASPDLQGISKLVVAFMSSLSQPEAIDLSSTSRDHVISPDEQARLISMFHKASWLSKQLHLDADGVSYWDPFIVRGIEFVLPTPETAINATVLAKTRQHTSAENPLLYDPNAPRPTTVKHKVILAKGETVQLRITLQNPLDVPLDIEQLTLISEGVQLQCKAKDIRIRPGCLDRLVVDALPEDVGSVSITGCCIKVAGCVQQDFHLTVQPWVRTDLASVKSLGQDLLHQGSLQKDSVPQYETVAVEIVEPQPQILLIRQRNQSSPMLLEGERQVYQPVFKNVSGVPAIILQLACDTDNIIMDGESRGTTINPGDTYTPLLHLQGHPSLSIAQASITYALSETSGLSRTCTLKEKLSIRPALKVAHIEVDAAEGGNLTLILDLMNYWQHPIKYHCTSADDDVQGLLPTGDSTRVRLKARRPSQSQKVEAATLQADFLKSIDISWSTGDRSGAALLSDIVLSERALSLLRNSTIDVVLSLLSKDSAHSVTIGEFVTVRATVTASQAIGAHIIQLRQRTSQPATDRQAALTGSTTSIITSLTRKQETTIDFSICPLQTGTVTLDAVLRPAQAPSTETPAEIVSPLALRLHIVE